ncbi:uncharacterized protein At5g08430-like isoform X1 [Ananas comosus]|uniref:Uncharacterized protein At5g08430-like isoform X1 n=1 Tax=Ananas comosus TaxID=4615 RepID=A0A6P5F330_ANACO|nr:uncharacterized protein At5g08430-like isoform X1 [Ananas comosus]
MGRSNAYEEEEIAEDFCFVCKDGGLLRACDYKNCLKAYHPQCVGRDPTFLETDEQWTCGWHSCSICKKSSSVQCFCCPNSVCHTCIREAGFVQVKKKNRALCSNCLRLAMSIEGDVQVGSDGCNVVVEEAETYKILFMDYWEIIKDKEGLSLVDLQAANALLRRGLNYKDGSDSDKLMAEDDELENNNFDNKMSLLADLGELKYKAKTSIKRPRSKKKNYVGWGSEELIGFLSSIGKDTTTPLTQLDCCEIVKEYIQANNLSHPDKKKKNAVCDEKLHFLFKKKKVKLHKIYSLLESHFASNGDSDEEFSFSSDEGENSVLKKKRILGPGSKKVQNPGLNHDINKVLQKDKCYASIVADNIKLLYLKKSLVVNLLRYLETFEKKVMGCFVRVKTDPKDFYNVPQKSYQLGQVVGIKKALEPYKVGDSSTDVVLCVSNMWKDVQISKLSEDDFEEEECEELRELVKRGLFRRSTVAEFEEKVRSVHDDITNHWIDRELLKLDRLIDRANEKGWRRELYEYIDKRELLRTPAERQRLFKEIPPVIVDEEDTKDTTGLVENSHGEDKGSGVSLQENGAAEKHEEGQRCDSTEFAQNGVKDHSTLVREHKDERTCNTNGEAQLTDQRSLLHDSGKLEEKNVTRIHEHKEDQSSKEHGKTQSIIDLDGDDECANTAEQGERSPREVFSASDFIWHYVDPRGFVQGPFPLISLRRWRENGFFDDDFRVWRVGQSRENSILLIDALRLTS